MSEEERLRERLVGQEIVDVIESDHGTAFIALESDDVIRIEDPWQWGIYRLDDLLPEGADL